MKSSGSKSDSKKRKRDELRDPVPESSKKAKVHAQRKFAQGVSYNSPGITQIKDKVRPPALAPTTGPLLTGKCPNTEDFLTFLCFRRTSILPAKLDFFKDVLGNKHETSASGKKSNPAFNFKINEYNSRKQYNKKKEQNIRKEEDKKLQSHAVKALRKKYQEQRLAKQRERSVTKWAQKVKGKNMIRTRSSTLMDSIETERVTLNEKQEKNFTSLRSGFKRIQSTNLKSNKKLMVKHLRSGLRSRGTNNKTTVEVICPNKPPVNSLKFEKERKKPKPGSVELKTKESKGKKIEGFSDFSSDDNEPLLTVKKPKSGGKKVVKSSLSDSKELNKNCIKTRSRVNELDPVNVSTRPTRKTKEAAAIYMEMITKKLVSPEKNGDDDVSSVDSFPELPNAKRNEQRETEIKARALANQKVEAMQLTESKNLGSVKKGEIKSIENSKGNQKKYIKKNYNQENSWVATRRTKRHLLTEEFSKTKQNLAEEKKEIAICFSQPSTRSRHFESEKPFRRKGFKTSTVKSCKARNNKNERNKKDRFPKKNKVIKSAKSFNSSQKIILEQKGSCGSMNSESSSKNNVSKKSDKKIDARAKPLRRSEVKEKHEVVNSMKPVKKEEKFLIENSEGKDNKSKKELEKQTKEQPTTINQRPMRKCSRVDKLWISVEGFTSDEDDFTDKIEEVKIEASNAKTASFTGKLEKEEKIKKQELTPEKKVRNVRSSGLGKESKKCMEKLEARLSKTENLVKSEKSSSENAGSFKNVDIKEFAKQSNEKKGKKSGIVKGKKSLKMKKKIKDNNDEVKKDQNLGQKSQSSTLSRLQTTKTSSERIATVVPNSPVSRFSEEKKIVADENGLKKVEEQAVEKKEKVKDSRQENSLCGDFANKTKKGKKRGIKSEKVNLNEEKKLSEKKLPNADEENSGTGGRKRPVRQCSTREKRWIETDSDSFSFYETSDDEDNLPIVDFSDKIKSSLPTSDPKQTVMDNNKMSVKETGKIMGHRSDNFSESDEEPLKKKAHIFENEVSKVSELKTENFCESESEKVVLTNKVHKDLPALHPLRKNLNDSYAKGSDVRQRTFEPKVNQSEHLFSSFAVVSVSNEMKTSVDENNFDQKSENNQQIILKSSEKDVTPRKIGGMDKKDSQDSSVPRIERILHSLKKDGEKKVENITPYSDEVKVTFEKVSCQLPLPSHNSTQIDQNPYGLTISTPIYPPLREPISTHGLDLLSEVALPTTPNEKINSQTERIEKWLKDSLAADRKKRFSAYEDPVFEGGNRAENVSKGAGPENQETHYYYGKSVVPPAKPTVSSHFEFQKFGQLELLESQKLLKKNLFFGEAKPDVNRVEHQISAPKKALTSVQDLLKLQKERKDSGKLLTDSSPHLKNCKCNNCIVKKGWFKNKPVPKILQRKSPPPEDSDDSAKPFESLTKAFTKVSPEEKISKKSVSVAPMVVHSSSPTVSNDVMPGTPTPSSSENRSDKKGVFYQRKLSFLERMKERERKEAAAKSSPDAFSPNNESSVYAFEPEPEHAQKLSTPFRSKTRESRTSSASKSDEEVFKTNEDDTSTVISSGTQKPAADIKEPVKTSQSASIAVQVNLDSEVVALPEPELELPDGRSNEISTQTEVPEEDPDSPMFYIPLQQAKAADPSVSSDQQLIQGVALKLGTEGPMGPNQRVIMKAKLVTKPPDTSSIKAVMMPQPKRLFDQKNNNPPVGTVQPTTRKPPEKSIEKSSLSKSTDTDTVLSPKSSSPPSVEGLTAESNFQPNSNSEIELSSKVVKSPSTSSGGRVTNKKKEKALFSIKMESTEERSPSFATCSKYKKTSRQKSCETTGSSGSKIWPSSSGTTSTLVEAPTFHPTEKEFQDPFEFFERIKPAAEKFGLCRIVPPANFKPDCKVSDDMRFTAYNQYVHRMFHRWGPNIKEMMAIKKYLTTQSISLKQPPWIGGIEVDLPRLYQSVQNCGGLMKVMEKKKWNQVADMMKIPKAAQDRVTKLDDIYCKYLLPYDTLSHDERQKLFDEVEKDWAERQKAPAEDQGEEESEEDNYIEECEECVVKGRNMALNQFYRIARNTKSMWFRNPEPFPAEVENEFWKHVRERNHHVCVHSGSIDSSGWGYGFPVAKNNAFSKHPWNLKVLTNNCGSVLRSLGPVMGVTVPTLHVGMVFTAFCWYRDPHGLPWIEYLHTGAPKIWYGISDDNSSQFKEALAKLLPRYIKHKTIWLPSDTAMIPPDLLVEQGVSLCHTIQEPGQFILVFPRAFTSSICTGYLVSESVYFAQPSWLTTAEQVFKDIQESCEPSMFSLEKLLFSIATDTRSSAEVLKQVLPMVWHLRQKEIDGRKTLFNLGLKSSERLPPREFGSKKKKGRWAQEDEGDHECEVCRKNLYVSLVINAHEEGVYCLPHAVDLLTQKRHHLKYCKLMYSYSQEEMNDLIEKLKQRIESKSQKSTKIPNKPSSTSPTSQKS